METLTSGLKYELTSTAPCCFKMQCTVPAAATKRAYADVLTKYLKNVPQKGFRAGHVPQKMVLAQYGKSINGEAASVVCDNAVNEVFREKKLQVVPSTIHFEDDSNPDLFKSGEEFSFSITLEAYADIKAPEYKGLALTRPARDIKDEEVEEAARTVVRSRGTYAVVDAPAKEGDMIEVSYAADDVPAELLEDKTAAYLLKNENAWQMLREPETIPGLNAVLTGVKAGESKDATISYPADFRVAALAGKSFAYHFTLKSVHALTEPELNEQFFNGLGVKDMTDLKTRLKARMIEQDNYNANRALVEQATKALLEGQDFPLPPSVLASETKAYLDDKRGPKKEDGQPDEAAAANEAARNLRLARILTAIAQAENLQPGNNELSAYCYNLAMQTHSSPDKIAKDLFKDRDRVAALMMMLQRDMAMQFVVKNANVTVQKEGGAAEAAPVTDAPAPAGEKQGE